MNKNTNHLSSIRSKKKKIEWLQVLQGFSILLVIIVHVNLTNTKYEPMPLVSAMIKVILTFVMPLFMFTSGWLFYFSCIGKDKTYREVIKSKFKRLGIPFFVFTMIATLLKLVFPSMMKRPVDWHEIINTFVFFRSNPLKEMWFVIALFILMLMYPIFKYLLQKGYRTLIGGVLVLVIFYTFPKDFTYFSLPIARHMLPFFFAGIVACKYEITEKMDNWWWWLASIVLFVVFNLLIPHWCRLLTNFTGIMLPVVTCRIVAKRWPSLFSSFRDYSYQIYLMGIFFQMPIRWLYVWVNNESLYIPFYISSLLIGLFIPTLIAKLAERHAPQWMKNCLGVV